VTAKDMSKHTCAFDGPDACRECAKQRRPMRGERVPYHANQYERRAAARRAAAASATRRRQAALRHAGESQAATGGETKGNGHEQDNAEDRDDDT
jgi:hypothetical protein